VAESDIAALITKARAASSMRGNPIDLEDADLGEILRSSL